jgi:hypothetical protein
MERDPGSDNLGAVGTILLIIFALIFVGGVAGLFFGAVIVGIIFISRQVAGEYELWRNDRTLMSSIEATSSRKCRWAIEQLSKQIDWDFSIREMLNQIQPNPAAASSYAGTRSEKVSPVMLCGCPTVGTSHPFHGRYAHIWRENHECEMGDLDLGGLLPILGSLCTRYSIRTDADSV